MKFNSGGYYIVSPTKREEYMDENLLPDNVLSASECVCDFYPEIDILWGRSRKKKLDYAEKLKLTQKTFDEMEDWIEEKSGEQTFHYPQMFTTVELARQFSRMFLGSVNDIKIIGIGLPENLVEAFLYEEESASKPDEERYGIETLLINKTAMDHEESKINGYEVLGFEDGSFHSYICNGLEKYFHEKCSFSLNENGFIPTRELAMEYCHYSNDDDLGTEPVLWLPWAIFEYKIY